jgi:EmrB/QacA subfamily drug resistance transporter
MLSGMDRKWWTLIAVCVATFMLLLDITIVNVALPDIQRQLDASFSELQWVVDAYSLMLAAVMLTAGSLADLFGRRLIFTIGLVMFTVASFLCGIAWSAPVLDVFRGLQGLGGAAMFATSLALLAQSFHGRERGTAFGIWGATIGGAVAIGPLVGGALTQGLGWEWIFFLNIPIGIAAVFLTLRQVPESRDPDARGVDWLGVITFSGSLFLLVFALIRGNDEGWGSTQIVVMLLAALALFAGFLVAELRQERPMFDLTLLRNPTFAGASIAAFSLSASMFAMFLYLTLYIQNVLGYGPLDAGWRFLPLTLISFFVAPVAGQLSERMPKRILLGVGLALVGVALLLMGGLSVSSKWTALLAGFLVAGVGIGMVNPTLASTAVGVVPPARSGMGSGINNTMRQVGIATGIAALGAVFQHRVEHKAAELLGAVQGIPAGASARLADVIGTGQVGAAVGAAPPAARGQVADVARSAFISGFNDIFILAAVVAFVGGVLSFALVRERDFVAFGAPGEVAPAAHGA